MADGDPAGIHRSLPGYASTPLVQRPDLAGTLGVAQVLVKDESCRFGLGAFKALGASHALALARRRGERDGGTVCTATEGNHGRAVAWAARFHGLEARVFVPRGTDPVRLRAIEGEGGRVEEVAGDYEAAVEEAQRMARSRGWLLVQDTAWDGYTEVPLEIMQGYTTALRELDGTAKEGASAGGDPPVDVVFLQAGVGSWAAAAAAYLRVRWGAKAPRVAVVEPTAAACVLESVKAERLTEAQGSRRTAMSGLNCGMPSTLAFPLLRRLGHAFVAVGDAWAQDAVKALADGTPSVRSAPAGAAGLAGLMALVQGEASKNEGNGGTFPVGEARRALRLGGESRVLVVNTEGPWGRGTPSRHD